MRGNGTTQKWGKLENRRSKKIIGTFSGTLNSLGWA